MLGDGIEITITEISGDKVKLGISAPADVKVYRKELYSTIQDVYKRQTLPCATRSSRYSRLW